MAAKGEKQEPIICTNCNFGIIPEIDSKKMRVLFRCPECNQWNKRKNSEQMKKDGKGRKRIRLEAEEEEGRSDEGKMAKLEGEGGPAADLYCAKMKKLLFNTIPFYGAKNALSIPYHFASSLKKTDSSISATTAKRLAKEIANLHNSLPISAKSSIFVRACEERSDVMKVLITGPAETPYANGCFEFDVFFPSNYPNVPMQINFETTGNKSVRFNPNLYYDGKVCLSILNTWQGSAAERWIPAKSTLLQVLVSIQALVLVEEPFYNEPGFEKMRNNAKYGIHSLLYTLRVRQLCLKWAMLQQLQNPPKAFTDVIQCHFWLKREEICAQVEEWIKDYEGLVKAGKLSKADLAGNPDVNANTMKKDYEKLKAKFSAMKCPPTLEEDAMKDDGNDIDNKIDKA